MQIGDRLRQLREKKGWTQKDLADYIGVTAQAVSSWEIGKTFPDIVLVPALSKLYNVTSDYLLCINSEIESDSKCNWTKEINKLVDDGELLSAIKEMKLYLKEYPDDFILMQKLIRVMYKLNDESLYTDIIEKWKIIEKYDRNVANFLQSSYIAIFTYIKMGKYEEARKLIPIHHPLTRGPFEYKLFKAMGETEIVKSAVYDNIELLTFYLNISLKRLKELEVINEDFENTVEKLKEVTNQIRES